MNVRLSVLWWTIVRLDVDFPALTARGTAAPQIPAPDHRISDRVLKHVLHLN